MLNCFLSAKEKRNVSLSNYNHHHHFIHADRIMQEHDLIYMMSGEWEVWQDDVPYLLHEGDILFLSAGHHHYGLKPCTSEVDTIYIHFSALPSDRCSEELFTNKNEFLFPTHLHLPVGSGIPLLLKQLVAAYWQQHIYAFEEANAFLSLVLCEMSLLAAEKAVQLGTDELVKRLLHTIESTPNRFYSVDELCELINVSRKTLHNYFKQICGMSPHAYQLDYKLQSARRLLEKEPDTPLETIVRKYGFCDEYHFSRMFKKAFSLPPRKYAKSIQNLHRDSSSNKE